MTQRSNVDWIRELRGDCDRDVQRQAHEDLGNYLYVVAYNYLRLRQADLPALAAFAPEDAAALAQDFVQETLEKLARDDFALLGRYRSDGRFTSWAAQVVRNQAAMELRKSYWTRRISLPEPGDDPGEEPLELPRRPTEADADANPEHTAARAQVNSILQACLERLPERNRLAIVGCIADDLRAEAVAQQLNTTANAVYLLITRGKRQLRDCLQRAGLSRDVLSLFDAG